jgi:hypothetical protein
MSIERKAQRVKEGGWIWYRNIVMAVEVICCLGEKEMQREWTDRKQEDEVGTSIYRKNSALKGIPQKSGWEESRWMLANVRRKVAQDSGRDPKIFFGPECKMQNEGSKRRRFRGGYEEEKGV